ncbi:MAG TPA: prolyl oligopeptidase family serine peptidase, partial [Candidatus Angelobacter sp.]
RHLSTATATRQQVEDLSLFVKDGYSFHGPLRNPKVQRKYAIKHLDYLWGSRAPRKAMEPDSVSFFGFPKEWTPPEASFAVRGIKNRDSVAFTRDEIVSPNKTVTAVVEDSFCNLKDPRRAFRTSQIVLKDLKNPNQDPEILVPTEKPRSVLRMLGWGSDGTELYYANLGPRLSSLNAISVTGNAREIYREEAGFSLPNPSSEISNDRRTVVLVRTTNIIPDELVKIDLISGRLTTLWSPNNTFKTKAQPRVRFLAVEGCDADFYGRLYLPSDYDKGKKYPLVFTNYVSGPGFDASVGDEVPVLAFVNQGIAVFAMNSREANITSSTRDFRFEISRMEKPLCALEWVHRRLTDEGVIDPQRCGLTGLSYGAEIAMYAYWKTKIFRAVSVAAGSVEPTTYVSGGIPFATFLDSQGFDPPDVSYGRWRELSAGLNGRPDLPPLLIQSSDGEEYFTVETWFRLRRAGAAVEWYEYPGEGHVKRGPANKWWVYQRNLDWFRYWLKSEEDPDSAKAEQYVRWHKLQKLGPKDDPRPVQKVP